MSGVTSWGIYVELLESKCEGMVGLHDMDDDFYEVDQENYCVRGRMSGNTIRLGDKVLIEVKATSLRNRTIDFSLIERLESSVDETLLPPLRRTAPSPPAESPATAANGSGANAEMAVPADALAATAKRNPKSEDDTPPVTQIQL